MSGEELTQRIEERVAASFPDVEVLLAERIAAEKVRVVIDRRDGAVDLGLCEDVTKSLRELLDSFGLEVSSPGVERPLTKPGHFRHFMGQKARVRTTEPREGQRNFTGEIVGASDEEVTLAADNGVVSIPFGAIKRSNLVEG